MEHSLAVRAEVLRRHVAAKRQRAVARSTMPYGRKAEGLVVVAEGTVAYLDHDGPVDLLASAPGETRPARSLMDRQTIRLRDLDRRPGRAMEYRREWRRSRTYKTSAGPVTAEYIRNDAWAKARKVERIEARRTVLRTMEYRPMVQGIPRGLGPSVQGPEPTGHLRRARSFMVNGTGETVLVEHRSLRAWVDQAPVWVDGQTVVVQDGRQTVLRFRLHRETGEVRLRH